MKKRFLFSRAGAVVAFAVTLSLITFTLICFTGCPKPSPERQSPGVVGVGRGETQKREHRGGAVHGTVVILTDSNPGGKRIVYPPNFQLFLQNQVTGETVEVYTDVYGRYYFPRQKAGTYALRWPAQRGFADGQFRTPITLSDGEAYPPRIQITPQKGNVIIVGRVTFANGDATGFIQEVYGLIKTPMVHIHSPQTGLMLDTPSDYQGNYAAGVNQSSLRAGLAIKASLDAGQVEKLFNQNLETEGTLIADLTITNALPRVSSIVARDTDGKFLRHAQPGQKVVVEINATDADGDKLTAQWLDTQNLTPEAGSLKAAWKLPANSGVYTIEAVVTDGRGGYSRGHLALPVGKVTELFSGIVVDKITQKPVVGAQVQVNDARAESAKNGFFTLKVPLADSYVLNIRKPGYVLASQTFDKGSTGRRWPLVRTHSVKVDLTKEFTLADERPQWLEKHKLSAHLLVLSNTLAYENGDVPTGPISASIATIDIGDNEAPGDWVARDSDGSEAGLISYGMVYVEFADSQGHRLNLRKGAVAHVEIPVASGRNLGHVLEKAPNTIPVWSYDEKSGYWKPSGKATLDRQRGLYVGEVEHFSTINMDQKTTDVTCIRVLADPQLIGKTLRISDVTGDGVDYATVKEAAMDEPVNAIYRIPANQKVRLEVFDSGNPVGGVVIEEFDTTAPQLGWQKLADNTVVAGGPLASLWPAYPYLDCPKWVTLRFEPSGGSGNAFLVYKQIGDAATTDNYYKLVSPGTAVDLGNRGTLQKWWTVNGFSSTGDSPSPTADFHRTSYLNDNDLGSGRDMNFLRRSDGTVAAYVSNYGQFNQDQNNADLAFARDNLGNKVATVCMEWSPMENASGQRLDKAGIVLQQNAGESLSAFQQRVRDASIVKFFVFVDDDGDGNPELRKFADLDGYGAKFVPNLCLNCHAGNPKLAADFVVGNLGAGDAPTRALAISAADVQAHFRELDYATYKFRLGAPTPTTSEKAEFKSQNEQVRSGANDSISPPEIKNIIDLWYAGGAPDIDQQDVLPDGWTKAGAFTVAQNMQNPPVSFDWAGVLGHPFQPFAASDQPESLYANVVSKSCRTCHAAFGHDPAQAYNLDYHDYPQYLLRRDEIGFFINNTPPSFVMPHAVITYRNFWLSDPHRPTLLRQYHDNNWQVLGP